MGVLRTKRQDPVHPCHFVGRFDGTKSTYGFLTSHASYTTSAQVAYLHTTSLQGGSQDAYRVMRTRASSCQHRGKKARLVLAKPSQLTKRSSVQLVSEFFS